MVNVIESPNGLVRLKLGNGWITLTGGGASQVGNAILRVPNLTAMYALSPEIYINDICVVVDLMRVYQYIGPDPALETSWDMLSGQYFNVHEVDLPAHLGNLTPQDATLGDLAYIQETTELKVLLAYDPTVQDNWVYLASRPKLWNNIWSQDEMTALLARRGDFAIRKDLNAPEGQTWYLNGDDPSNPYEWFLMPGGNPIGDESWEHVVGNTEPPLGPDGILWLNPDEVPPLSGSSLLFDLDALIDVDLTTNPPTDLQPLVYSETRDQWVPGSAVGEVVVGATDPIPTNPGSELWFYTTAAPPPDPAPIWNPATTYLLNEEVSWPAPAADTWKALLLTTGQEPGIPVPVLDAYQFKGSTGAVEGLSADVSASVLNFSAGCVIRVKLHNGVSNGYLFAALDVADNIAVGLEVDSANSQFVFNIRTTTTPLTAPFTSPFANFDVATRPWIRVVADAAAQLVTFYDSADGVTWVVVGAPAASVDPFDVPATNKVRIGNDRLTPAKNYSGALEIVESYLVSGVRATAWHATGLTGAAPGEDGTGNVAGSSEFYTATNPGSYLIPITHTYDAWEVVPPYVPPVVLPGILRARVLGEWEDVQPSAGTYLPLEGGTMSGDIVMGGNDIQQSGNLSFNGGKTIQFTNETGAKINLYSNTFGLGVESGTTTVFGSSKISFRANASNGTEWFSIESGGTHQRTAGHIYTDADGYGFFMNSGGGIYKRSGGGIVIRKHSGNTNVAVENNDGSNRQDIVLVSGNQNVDMNNVTAADITHTTSSQTGFSVIAGSNGSNSNHYYVNCDTNDGGGYYFNVLEARRQDNKTVFQLKGCQYEVASNGVVEAQAKMFVSKGAEGTDEVSQWADYGDGQSCLLVHGPCSATHFQDRNFYAAVAGTAAPVDPVLAGQLIDAVRPVTFSRHFRSPDASDANEPGFVRPEHDPIQTVGLDTIDLAAPLADRLLGRQPGEYSVGGMLAVAIAEIKSLRARLAEVESRLPEPKKKRG